MGAGWVNFVKVELKPSSFTHCVRYGMGEFRSFIKVQVLIPALNGEERR